MGRVKVTRVTPTKLTDELAAQINADIQQNELRDMADRGTHTAREMSILPVGYEDEIDNIGLERVFANVENVKQICEREGIYMLLPTKELLQKGEAYFNANWDRINGALEKVLTPYLRSVLAEDYARVLAGVYTYRARIPEMEAILKAVTAVHAYRLDLYGLYVALLSGYNRVLLHLNEYKSVFRTGTDETPTVEAKQAYLKRKWGAYEAQAFNFLINYGEVKIKDFVGMGLQEITDFLDKIGTLSTAGDYMTYYIVCKNCFGLSPEDLATITPPPLFGSVFSSMKIAEETLKALDSHLSTLGEEMDAIEALGKTPDTEKKEQALQALHRARTPEERESALQAAYALLREAQEAQSQPTLFDEPAQEEHPQGASAGETVQDAAQVGGDIALTATTEAMDIVRLPENFGLLMSRGLCGGVGGNANDILPIREFIRDYVEREGLDKLISPHVVEKAVEGLNLMQRFERVRPENGLYTYHTNISKFAEACGYKDANDEEKKALLTALGVLNGLYLIVWKTDGRRAIKVLSLREIGLDGKAAGNLILDISEEAMKGRPNLMTWNELQEARKMRKGQADFHFYNQIKSKSHMRADALQEQVFGYDILLLEASAQCRDEETRQEQIRNAKEYIRKNKARDRKRLRKMFDKYAERGILKYTEEQNTKGETVFKWENLIKPKLKFPTDLTPQEEQD